MTTIVPTATPAPAKVRRHVDVPGVAGYAARYVAAHLDKEAGGLVDSWPATSAGGTLAKVGSTATLMTVGDDGEYYLTSPGGQSTGGRALGPHTTQRPFTIAAVVKANAGAIAFMGMTGIALARRADGVWYQTASNAATQTSTDNSAGWVVVFMNTHADGTHSLTVGGVTTAKGSAGTAVTSFGGFYFGSSTAGQTAHLREAVVWHSDLSSGDRVKVTEYFKSRYAGLV